MKNIIITLLAILASILFASEIDRLRTQNNELKTNQSTLLTQYELKAKEAQRYKVQDSLNAITINALELSIKDYKKLRASDYELIKQLKHSKSELDKVIATSLQTHDTIKIPVITPDSIGLRHFCYNSKWLDLTGCLDLNSDSVELSFTSRESLKVVETITYKRFLGFLWKTNKVKSRQIDIVSENPSTQIINTEFVSISN